MKHKHGSEMQKAPYATSTSKWGTAHVVTAYIKHDNGVTDYVTACGKQDYTTGSLGSFFVARYAERCPTCATKI
jgi:hypothetical protein